MAVSKEWPQASREVHHPVHVAGLDLPTILYTRITRYKLFYFGACFERKALLERITYEKTGRATHHTLAKTPQKSGKPQKRLELGRPENV